MEVPPVDQTAPAPAEIQDVQIGALRVRMPRRVGSCLNASIQALQRGDAEQAIEWIAAAAVCDIQQYQETLLKSAAEASVLVELYLAAFKVAGLEPALPVARPDSRPLRVAYVLSQIASGQGPARRITSMVELHDRSVVEPFVFSAEELTARRPERSHLQTPHAPSEEIGGEYLRRMQQAGVNPVIVPTRGGFLDAGRWLTEQMRAVDPDVAVFVGSVASPIQAIAAYLRVAPVQINQNIGVPLPLPSFEGMIYHNRACVEIDRQTLSSRQIRPCSVDSVGTDCAVADSAAPIPRSDLGIPRDAFVLCAASNKLEIRALHGRFAERLADFMLENPEAWWLAIGRGEMRSLRAYLGRRGVLSRVVFTGPAQSIHGYIKAADVYLNEYPEGGGNTVLESMACGVPVVAMRFGPRHAESIGAELVGPELAVQTEEDYWALAAAWRRDPHKRSVDGDRCRKRVRERFSLEATCRQYERHYEALTKNS